MRNKMLQLFLLLGLTISVAGFAQAQTGSVYRADIPFDFSVKGKLFKAGEYTINFGVIRESPASFLISSTEGDESAIVNVVSSNQVLNPNYNARLVFDKEGDDYSLAEIKTPWKNVELLKAKKKQKSAKVTGVEVSMVRR